jgi:hypothetical protein
MFLPSPDQQGLRFVQFSNNTNDDIDLPEPILLNVHYAIANILHASGRGEAIDSILDDLQMTRCLAADGSTDFRHLFVAYELAVH